MTGPRRIVCLTDETTETLYRLGEQDRIVGISAFTVRPPEARRDKPAVSRFLVADIDAIVSLGPDLVLAFSDLQASICADLIRRGLAVHCFNQRSIEGILEMIATLGRLIGRSERADALIAECRASLDAARRTAESLPVRPRVFFEEWPRPIIVGIRWVSELIELAGGVDCFPEMRERSLATDRVVSPEEVLERCPDLYLASWCGKPFRLREALARPEFAGRGFPRPDRIVEIPSSIILQPGPAALTEGLTAIQDVIGRVAYELANGRPALVSPN